MLHTDLAGQVLFNNIKPHHAVTKANKRQLVDSFNKILSTMTHSQRQKVEKETEALWVLINTSF
jgi:hypothetical protein